MVPTLKRHPAGYFVEHENQKILLDCGHATIARLIEMRISLDSINAIAVSHFHTDHFSDCFPLVHARFVDDVQNKREHQELTLIGPSGLKQRYAKWREIFWPEPGEHYPLKFIEGPNHSFGPLTTFVVNHVPWFESVGFTIRSGKKKLIYTGDLGSQQSKEFYKAIEGADILLIECGALSPTPNHFSVEQAIELARKYRIKKVLLTHLRDKNIPQIKKVANQYPQLVSLAQDKMVVVLN